MRRLGARRLWGTAACCAAFCGATAAEVSVRLTHPRAGVPVFGEIEVTAEARAEGEEVARVDFFLDSRRVGGLTEPPWRITVHLEEARREHHLEVVAYGTAGGEARDGVRVESIHVDEAVDLELQQLYVTVTRGGRRVLGLGRGDFTVLDRGQRQRIVTLAFGDVPFTAILLVDDSVSMEDTLAAAARRGAEAFVAGMTPLDEARAMVFNDHLVAASPFTGDPAVLGAALEPPRTPGGTALNDHLYWAVRLLERRLGRRVAVLLSDGRDVHSVLDMEQVREAVRRSQTMIYWVRLILQGHGGPISTSYRTLSGSRRQIELLRDTVKESGGRILTSRDGEGIERALAEVLQELREQYAIGYYPDPRLDDGSWRPVTVELRGSGTKARTAAGYVDFPRADD